MKAPNSFSFDGVVVRDFGCALLDSRYSDIETHTTILTRKRLSLIRTVETLVWNVCFLYCRDSDDVGGNIAHHVHGL